MHRATDPTTDRATARLTARTTDIVVCSPLRTPVGRFGGSLSTVPAADLAAGLVRAVLERTGLAPDAVDDVVIGQCNPNGDAPAIGRVVALDAGLAASTAGQQVDRRCGSGLQAVLQAAMQVQTGFSDLVIAGGAENMSQVEHYLPGARWGVRSGGAELVDRLARARQSAGGRDHPIAGGMVETAENVRRDHEISREDQDRLALHSQERAAAAQANGLFAQEIVPVEVGHGAGRTTVSVDEHIRPDLTMTALAGLRPVLAAVPGATVTAGNSSGQNDAAALCIVTTRARADRLGLRPSARLVTAAVAGTAPETMGVAPVPAVARAFTRSGLGWKDMDLIEVNEAFAAQVLACTRSWGFAGADFERTNVNGSGISLGHPVGATGARILATVLHELERRQGRYAIETMCIGGGQGLAAIFERAAP